MIIIQVNLTVNRFTEAKELHGLINLLKSTSRYVLNICKEAQLDNYNTTKSNLLLRVRSWSKVLLSIISTFKQSCQTPLLVGPASSCIMDMAEVAIKVNTDIGLQNNLKLYMHQHEGLYNIRILIKVFLDEYDSIPLPSRPVHLKEITELGTSDTWDLYECQNVFDIFFKLYV